jgi:cytochrome P450
VSEERVDPEIYYDPYDYSIDANPHAVWRRMRDEMPVYRNDQHDFFALSRYADVLAASTDVATFSSAHSTVLPLMTAEPDQLPGSILFMDPPSHDVLRRLISRAFTPRQVAALEDEVRGYVRGLLEEVGDRAEFDYVGTVAARLPPMVIGAYLGLPASDSELRRTMTDEVLHIKPDDADYGLRHHLAMVDYYRDQVRERVAQPRDDMISALCAAEAELDGKTRRLTEQEIVDFIVLMSSAGNETVARLLGWAAVLLAQHPDQRARLVDDPALIPNAVEELLRYEAPSPVQGRWVEREVSLHGTTIPAGSKVLLLNGSALRDDRQFPDPDHFDVTRHFEGQLAFGHGIHFCLGAALARVESRIALEETLAAMPAWEVGTVEMVHTASVRGPASVMVSRLS